MSKTDRAQTRRSIEREKPQIRPARTGQEGSSPRCPGASRRANGRTSRYLDATLLEGQPYRMADPWGCRKAHKNLNGTRRYQLGAVLTLLDPKGTWNGRAYPYFEKCEAERMSTRPPSSTTVLHAKRAPTQPSSTTQAPHSHSPAPISKTSISIPSVAARVRGQLSRKPHPSQLRIVQKSDS